MHARLCSVAMCCKPKPDVLLYCNFLRRQVAQTFGEKKKERRKPLDASILADSGVYHPHFEVC